MTKLFCLLFSPYLMLLKKTSKTSLLIPFRKVTIEPINPSLLAISNLPVDRTLSLYTSRYWLALFYFEIDRLMAF